MITSLLKLCTKTCAKILYDNSPDRKVLDNYTREELNLIIDRIKAIRYTLKCRRFIRANALLFKFQEMIHKVLWTLSIYDIETAAYELEKYIVSDALYNDLKEAMNLDIKFGNPIQYKSLSIDQICNLFKSSYDIKSDDTVSESLQHLTTEYIEDISNTTIEIMTSYRLVEYIVKLMFITDVILDHIKERLE